MKSTSPNTKVVYHDSSLSSFITGAVIGVVTALALGTKEGRKLTQDIIAKAKATANDLSDPNARHDLQAQAEQVAESISHFTENLKQSAPQIIDRLHRNPPEPVAEPRSAPPQTTSPNYFVRGGKPLRS